MKMTKFLQITFFLIKKKLLCTINNLNCLFLVLIALFTPLCTTPQVFADFTNVNSINGCESLVVEFQDISSGNPTSWLWDFGNGITSNLKNPTVVYNSPGEYDVTLEVTDGIYSDVKTYNSLVKVYEKPTLNINVSNYNGCGPLVSSFNGISNSNIVSWYWDFGDGGYSNSQAPNYVFEQPGEYSVTLSVIDNNGCQALIIENNLITVKELPVASFHASNVFSCDSSELINFVNTSYNASNYTWIFDDGSTSNLVNPSKLYNIGFHSVTLLAKKDGCIDTLVLEDYINIVGYEDPKFSIDTNYGCEGIAINFFNNSIDDSASFIWQFDTISSSFLENPIQVFNDEGLYDITLIMNGLSGCTSSVTYDNYIKIFPNPKIIFSCNDQLNCMSPVDVNFIDSSLNSSMWLWDFGDGNTSYVKNPVNTYLNEGLYDVTLTVFSDYGCSITDTFFDYIEINKYPELDIQISKTQACVGQQIFFNDISNVTNNNWLWNFGDDSISLDENPTHSYNDTGLYSVSLISGINSCIDTIIINDAIKIIEPSAKFNSKHNCSDPLTVDFVNLSVGADYVNWDFGDGNTSNLLNPSHEYANTGTYNVVLTVFNNLTECSHTIKKDIQITKPIANFDYLINSNNSYEDSISCVPKRVHLKNLSKDWDFFQVYWSDGSIEDGRLDHLFVDTGLFDVTMIITDVHKCKDTFTINNMFHLYDLNTDFKTLNSYGCDSLFLDLEILSDYPLNNLTWDFGNGSYSSSTNPTVIYPQEGIYDVSLYTHSIYGCKDTISYYNYVEFIKPKSIFYPSDDSVCIGQEILLQNFSEGFELSYFWEFGDGNTSLYKEPNYSYSNNGVYDISLEVTDSLGCSNKYTFSEQIHVLSPFSNFSIDSLSSKCIPSLANFVNSSSTDAIFFSWNFGDGITSNIENPSHLYTSNDIFDITLVVENLFGCSDTSLKINFLDVSSPNPEGYFTVSSNIVCNNEELTFTSNTQHTDSVIWHFGNGSYLSDSIVSYSYLQSGEFLPTLVLYNDYGCQSIINNNDTIQVYEIVVNALEDIQVCKGEIIELNAIGNAPNYCWYPQDSVDSPFNSSTYTLPLASMIYYVYNSNDHCTSYDSVIVEVFDDIPEAFFTAENFCEGDSTLFFGSSTPTNSTNLEYNWSFNQSGSIVSEILNIGNNLISLSVMNLDNGCSDTFSNNISIIPKPNIDFTVNNNSLCLGDTLNIHGMSFDSILSWKYTFDGLDTLLFKDVDYLFLDPGPHLINLEVTSTYGCVNTISKNIVINDNPKVDFICIDNCEEIGNTFIDLSSVDNDTIAYIYFNIENNLFLDSIVNFIFDRSGKFDVSLTAYSSKGCSKSILKETNVYPKPKSNFTIMDICENTVINLNSHSTISSGNIIQHDWIINSDSSISNQNMEYFFNEAGINTITHKNISDYGCKSQLTRKFNVFELPENKFSVKNTACVDEMIEIKFNGNSNNIKKWSYFLGNGSESSEVNPKYIYTEPGVYDITLETNSDKGCINDTTIVAAIQVFENPYVNFISDKVNVSEYDSEITITNLSEDSLNFEWLLEDRYFSNELNPIFTFNDPKSHEIFLKGTNKYGCSSFAIKNINVIPVHTFFAPNSFTPNNDGLNDIFKVNASKIKEFEILIYNRWGELIFTSNNPESGWDGKNREGVLLSADLYTYQTRLIDLNNKNIFYNGEIKLIR